METTASQPLNYSSGFSHSGILPQIPFLICLTSAKMERNNQMVDESTVLPPHWECLEPGWSPDLRPPGPLWNTGFLHRQRAMEESSATSFRVWRFSAQVTMISRTITCVSLVISDEALRQESHHERCNEGGGKTPFKTSSGRKKEELFCSCDFEGKIRFGSMCVLTCFAHSAASNHSHFYDPVGKRAVGRRTLGDRRHVVDETHGFLLGEAETVPKLVENKTSTSPG